MTKAFFFRPNKIELLYNKWYNIKNDTDNYINIRVHILIFLYVGETMNVKDIISNNILLVTANKNETDALINCASVSDIEEIRSEDGNDPNFYRVAKLGHYNIVHFELMKQGSVGTDASQLSIYSAITMFKPKAVILIGIAFGKRDSDEENPNQEIGDVIISTQVTDFASGKVKDGKIELDGPRPEAGRNLLAAFKHYGSSWEYTINERKAKCQFGLILSGDEIVDDKQFKHKLFELFPRAIGGEMEGRGAYASCRSKGIDEWIIVKGICDWGDGTKSVNKENNQKIAAKSAVSLLEYVFSHEGAFAQLFKPIAITTDRKDNKKRIGDEGNKVIGYFINFGITSCRIFEVHKGEKQSLKKSDIFRYELTNYKNKNSRKKYLNGIIELVKSKILPKINEASKSSRIFIKTFADSNFSSVFGDDEESRNDFIMKLYSETSLYFNIVSKKQTEENLKRLFGTIHGKTVILNIGMNNTDLFFARGNKFDNYDISISINKVSEFIRDNEISEIWDKKAISLIKTYIKESLGNELHLEKVDSAIILKDELTFMKDNAYPLVYEGGQYIIAFDEYCDHNREYLFSTNYYNQLSETYNDEAIVKYYYGFKVGHIILETIFDFLNVETIIPSDELSIHGSPLNAYVFNVAISGSANEVHAKDMIEACRLMTSMGANVLSPVLNSRGKLPKKDKKSDVKHATAIRKCDLLFVSNKGGYIGEQTAREIYGAFLLNKPIALWTEPKWDDPECRDRLGFIPHEDWGTLIPYLEEDEN